MALKELRNVGSLLLAFALVGLGANRAHAADCTQSKVAAIIDIGTSQCGGKVAFKSSVASSGNRWICTANDSQGRLVLAAFLAGKSISYEFTSTSSTITCDPGSTPYAKTTRYITVF